ncbi:hypothetical protein ACFY2V_17750 [Streptomyces eurythermus]
MGADRYGGLTSPPMSELTARTNGWFMGGDLVEPLWSARFRR